MNLTLAADALHPNNNAESVNLGAVLDNKIPGFGEISIRGGIKGGMNNLFTENTDFGVTAGAGVKFYYLGNLSVTSVKSNGLCGSYQICLFSSISNSVPRYELKIMRKMFTAENVSGILSI